MLAPLEDSSGVPHTRTKRQERRRQRQEWLHSHSGSDSQYDEERGYYPGCTLPSVKVIDSLDARQILQEDEFNAAIVDTYSTTSSSSNTDTDAKSQASFQFGGPDGNYGFDPAANGDKDGQNFSHGAGLGRCLPLLVESRVKTILTIAMVLFVGVIMGVVIGANQNSTPSSPPAGDGAAPADGAGEDIPFLDLAGTILDANIPPSETGLHYHSSNSTVEVSRVHAALESLLYHNGIISPVRDEESSLSMEKLNEIRAKAINATSHTRLAQHLPYNHPEKPNWQHDPVLRRTVELYVLNLLYFHAGGNAWAVPGTGSNWTLSDHPCDYEGVTCSQILTPTTTSSPVNPATPLPPLPPNPTAALQAEPRATQIATIWGVTSINLAGIGLTGTLPPYELSFLKNLLALNVSHNALEGGIPLHLPKPLTLLDLSHNGLSEEIPITLADLDSLETLRLQHNQLEGTLPTQLATSPALKEIEVQKNALEGLISAQFCLDESRLLRLAADCRTKVLCDCCTECF